MNKFSTNEEIDQFINGNIQGVFGGVEMNVFREEVSRLEPGQLYFEIGVDEGRSMTVAHFFAKPGVFVFGCDIHDVQRHPKSVGRGPWAEFIGMVGLKKRGFFIHGDADELAKVWEAPIDLLFIDGHHDYESVKNNTLAWEGLVRYGGTILFHDYDHPETKAWLDEYYGSKKEVFGGKIVRVKMNQFL